MRIVYTLAGEAVEVSQESECDTAWRIAVNGERIWGSWMNSQDARAAAYAYVMAGQDDEETA